MNTNFEVFTIDFAGTYQFSELVADYINNAGFLNPFYSHRPDINAFKEAINERKTKPVNRKLLQQVFQQQYERLNETEITAAIEKIALLGNENTFTVTTGHQLCLFTGPLYFIYKIISTINLAEELSKKYPGNHFIPVYWMASEDHDFEEINHLHLFTKKLTWQQEQKGASGQLSTDSLHTFLAEFKEVLGNSPNALFLADLFEKSYLQHSNLADATRYLVNKLFGKYGLIILDADDAALKRSFLPVMEDDILNHHAFYKVSETNRKLAEKYKIQVAPREINLFYLTPGSRERIIENENGTYVVNNTAINYSKEELLQELHNHPEKFSPNVVLRPVYQEFILPNLAYVGGPGEIAYWLQYKAMFDHYRIPFPVLVLRNCMLLLEKEAVKKLQENNLENTDLFKDQDELIKIFLRKTVTVNEEINFEKEKIELHEVFEKLKSKALPTDPTLVGYISGEQQKALNAIVTLEQKMNKSIKRKHETNITQIKSLKDKLFPDGTPQERHYNFAMFYLKYGDDFFEILKAHFNPLKLKYLVFEEKQTG